MRMPSLFLIALSALRLALAAESATPAPRPNILWVVSEDNNPLLGCYGEPLARTPHLDALARRGVLYRHAHSAAPVCAPSRASLITGQSATTLGSQHMRSEVPLPEGLRYYPAYLHEAGYYTSNRAKTDYNAATPPGTWDESSARAHWKNRSPGQPFFAVFNFGSSHESNLHERRPLQTDPARVRIPAYLPDTPEVRADIAQYHDCLATMDTQIGTLLAELAADGLAEDTIIFYYGDNGGVLPRSKRFLYDNGTRVPLIIAFPDKWRHLAPATPGAVSEEMVSLPDLAATVLSVAGLPVPDRFDGRALAGPARQPAPEYIHAFRDRMDEAYDLGRAVIGPRYRYIRNYRPELPDGQKLDYLWRMATTRDWERLHRAAKLDPIQSAFFQPRAPELLFDVTQDPDCVRNLAGDPAHQTVLEQMRAANRAHLLATRDLGFLPEPMLRRLAGDRSPTLISTHGADYPLADVLALLDELQLPATPPRERLDAALRHRTAVIRHWASLVAGQTPDVAPALLPLLDDPDSAVRLAAAYALLRHADLPAAWERMNDALQPDRSPEERLWAAHALTRLRPCPPQLRATLETSPAPANELLANYYRRLADSLLGRVTAPTPPRGK
ncbi:MAG: hypothetical protein QG602_567 [Verrucomicrobiota bacterium]|nr:hypothetical protein [Verrucomicrobiota bacterium]